MTRLHKYLVLSPSERRLLTGAWMLIAGIRLRLWFVGFNAVRRGLDRRKTRESAVRFPMERLSWAVGVASRYVPRASCLTQALVMSVLLERNGYPSRLLFGIARDKEGRLEAHAWVESHGRVVIGNANLDHFTPLSPI